MKAVGVALGLAEPEYPAVNLTDHSWYKSWIYVPSSAFAEEEGFFTLRYSSKAEAVSPKVVLIVQLSMSPAGT